ncbi:MAG: DNA polymerase Y family protein [Phycisphaerales bacterium]|nr:DNA polymerase Y family protein [Phycisphaerales bacterium]
MASSCAAAQKAGITPGMTLAHARALVEDLFDTPHCPRRNGRSLRALAQWMHRFSPKVAVCGDDAVLLDLSGMERLHPDLQAYGDSMVRTLASMGFAARCAVASTARCAEAVARFSGHTCTVVRDGQEEHAMAPLPLAVIHGDDTGLFSDIGARTVDDLRHLDRGELADRLGAMSRTPSNDAVPHEQPLLVSRQFDGPVLDHQSIAMTVCGLLERLCKELASRGEGVLHLVIRFERVDAEAVTETIGLTRPSRDATHLWHLLQPVVESVHLGFGVEAISAGARRAGRLRHEQHTLPGRNEPPAPDAAALLDRLRARLGDAAAEPMPQKERTPHDARPLLHLHPPQSIAVACDGTFHQRPCCMRWNGRDRRIITCRGPRRVASRWWRCLREDGPVRWRDLASTEHFQVQCEGGQWVWITRNRTTGQWHVEGVWS